MGEYPDDRKYDGSHTWVKKEGDNYMMGITQGSAGQVSEFVFVQLPDKGKKIGKGDVYVSLESAKWSGHVHSPISGKIVDINMDVFDEPSLLNKNAYDEWIVIVEADNPQEYDDLKDSNDME